MESSYVMSGVVAAQAKCASNGELKNLVDTGSRKVTGVPRLDEKQLEMKLPEVSAMAPPFIVSDMSAAAAEGPAAPLNLNPPVYVLGPSSPYNAAGVYAVDSPSASPAFVALMQQQAFQYQQMQQAVATEQEAAFVNKLIQQCSRPVLLMTLTSLLEEFPLLSTVIRQRCEKAMVIVSNQQQQQQNQHQQQQPQQQNQQQQQQQQQQKLHHQQHQNQNQQPQHPQQVAAASAVVGRFGPHGQDMVQWAGHAGNNNYESPRASSFACGNNTPQSTGARKGRGSKSREEGLCSLHNNVRSMNHLQLNKQKGVYECIHGFHCLEDKGSAAPSPSHLGRQNVSTIGKTNNSNGNGKSESGGNAVAESGAVGSSTQPKPLTTPAQSRGDTASCNGVEGANSATLPSSHRGGPSSVTSMDHLKAILQDVRRMAEMEEKC